MPVGLMGAGAGGSGGYTANYRSASATPGHATETIIVDPKPLKDLVRIGGSRPTWDRYGFIYTEEIVNPPTGSEPAALYTKITLYVNNRGDTLYLEMRGR